MDPKYERKLIKADGTIVDYPPKVKTYTLQELQTAVGGYIEFVALGEEYLLVINEEGKLHGLPRNDVATGLCRQGEDIFAGDWIAGAALVCRNGDVDGEDGEDEE